MRPVGVLLLLPLVLAVESGSVAQAQAIGGDRPPPGTATASLAQVQRWFELEAPFSRPLKIAFNTRATPTYEMLQLPTFEGTATLLQKGSFSINLFERVSPAFELDCRLTCVPMLEQSLGVNAKLNFGRINRQIPETFLFASGTISRSMMTSPRAFPRTLIGFGGLLDL